MIGLAVIASAVLVRHRLAPAEPDGNPIIFDDSASATDYVADQASPFTSGTAAPHENSGHTVEAPLAPDLLSSAPPTADPASVPVAWVDDATGNKADEKFATTVGSASLVANLDPLAGKRPAGISPASTAFYRPMTPSFTGPTGSLSPFRPSGPTVPSGAPPQPIGANPPAFSRPVNVTPNVTPIVAGPVRVAASDTVTPAINAAPKANAATPDVSAKPATVPSIGVATTQADRAAEGTAAATATVASEATVGSVLEAAMLNVSRMHPEEAEADPGGFGTAEAAHASRSSMVTAMGKADAWDSLDMFEPARDLTVGIAEPGTGWAIASGLVALVVLGPRRRMRVSNSTR